MSIVVLKDLYFSYEDGPGVLEGVDLCLDRGTISVLMGPSGAGKTTMLRLINLLEDPTSGEVVYQFREGSQQGKPDPLSLRRRMGFVFQEPALFDSSVGGNVAFGLMARGGFLNHFLNRAKKLVPFLKSNYGEVILVVGCVGQLLVVGLRLVD